MSPTCNAIGLVAQDLVRSLRFYRMLGLDIPPEADEQPHVEVTLDGGMRLLWDTPEVIRSFDPGWTPPSGGESLGLAFGCDTASEVDAVFAALVDAGFDGHLEPWDAVWGQRYATVRDPDGNSVSLYAPLG